MQGEEGKTGEGVKLVAGKESGGKENAGRGKKVLEEEKRNRGHRERKERRGKKNKGTGKRELLSLLI